MREREREKERKMKEKELEEEEEDHDPHLSPLRLEICFSSSHSFFRDVLFVVLAR